MGKTAKQYKEQLQKFHSEVSANVSDGFQAILPDGSVFVLPDNGKVSDLNWADGAINDQHVRSLQSVESSMCGCGSNTGILTASNPAVLSFSQYAYGNTPDEIGTPGKRYVQWGPYNAWPNLIYNAIAVSPFLSAVMDYLERTLFGLGPQVVYCITRYSGGTVTHEEVPYRDADVYLKEEIIRLVSKLESLHSEEASVSGSPDEAENGKATAPAVFPEGIIPHPSSQPDTKWRAKLIEKYESQLKEAENALESYWDTRARIDAFLENNSLTYFYKSWIADYLRLGISFPMIGLSRSGAGKWTPDIVDLDIRNACTIRFEERNSQFKFDYAYYSERWRDDAHGEMLTSEMVAYPTIMPEHALRDLRQTVAKNNRTKVGERPNWQCCPTYHPAPNKPVYPELAWWSIFPSLVYQMAVTSLFDKAAARKNSTLWGKILFINTAYLAQVFNQAGEEGKTKEGQAKIRQGIYQNVESFLKDRSNNGKLLIMDSYPSADEKQMIDSIRIVDVPRGDDVKASAQEIAEIASLVSFACNTNMDLVASRPWSTTSATGTAQRELHLLKNGQLSPDRLAFTDFFNNFVFPFNRYDRRFRMTVPYPTLTTLDASKTGIKTVTDGSDA